MKIAEIAAGAVSPVEAVEDALARIEARPELRAVITVCGDATLFTRNDEAEAQWRIIDPIEQAWATGLAPPTTYEAGAQGPEEANGILLGDDVWRAV